MNFIETGLALLEGLALIVSPCILPVLPLVLAASVDGGKKRPFGIIIGFILAFTVFAFLSRKLVTAFGLDLDTIKYGSLALLGLFGLVLLSEKLTEKLARLTQPLANIGNTYSAKKTDGFFSGVGIGALISLVWTPCAGPILATVLVQIIRQESDLDAMFLLLAFSFGAGLPMLAIALLGRSIIAKFNFLTRHTVSLRKAFGIVVLLAVTYIAIGSPIPGTIKQSVATSENGPSMMMQSSNIMPSNLMDALDRPYLASEFTGIEAWLNSKPLTMAELKGKVVLIDFWTYSCINCIRTFPYITKWDRAYRDKGLVIIGVHAPEFEFEKDIKNVENAIASYGIEYPVALDNKLDTWTAFQNRYWPAHYLIDQQGRVVYTHFGEGNYAETENNIRYLLGLDKKDDAAAEKPPTSRNQSPETYLGYGRASSFANSEGLVRDVLTVYTMPKFVPSDHWALSGPWTIGAEHITANSADAALQYNFTAGKVFLVLGSKSGKPIDVSLKLNGEPYRDITVDKHTLYELVDQNGVKNGLVSIVAKAPGLEAYAFTFGN